MTAPNPTLKDLLVGDDRVRSLPPVPAALSPVVTTTAWQGICDHVVDLLDISVIDVLLGAWKTQAEIRAGLRESAADPARTIVVQLARHAITSEHRPAIEVRAAGRAIATLHFPVDVAFEVEAVQLTLRRGEVAEIRSGRMQTRGTVKFESVVLFERQLEPLSLPGRLVLQGAAPASEGAVSAGDRRDFAVASAAPDGSGDWAARPVIH